MNSWTCDAAFLHRLADEYLVGVPIQGPPYITRLEFLQAWSRAGLAPARKEELLALMDRNKGLGPTAESVGRDPRD